MLTVTTDRARRHAGVLGSVVAASCAFGVYLYTLCPSVYAGDSGELSLACFSWGVPHPPGYPLFVLMGRIACLSNAAEPAVLTNLLCALLASLTVGGVFLLLYRVHRVTTAALAGAWMLAFGVTFWGQATITEVYPSVCLGVCTLLLIIEAVDRAPRPSLLYLLAYVSGLCLVLHQSLILLLPGVIVAFLPHPKKVSLWRAGILFGLGLTPYLLVLVRSMADPVIDWGDPESIPRLFSTLLRQNYGDLAQNSFSLGLVAGHAQAFFTSLLEEIPLAVLLFALPGMYLLNKERPVLSRFMLLSFLVFVTGLIVLIRPSLDSAHMYQVSFFFLPVYLFFVVWTAAGFIQIIRLAAHLYNSMRRRFIVPSRRCVWSVTGIAASFSLLVPIWLASANFERSNRRDFFGARTYGENILLSVPTGATLVTDGDNETFVLAYLCRALGRRPDVNLAHRKGFLFDAPDYIRLSARADLAARTQRWQEEILLTRSPVYYATWTDISSVPGWRLVREGLVFRAERTGAIDVSESTDRTARLFSVYDMGVLDRDPGALEYITRRFAIGYLQGMWEARATGASALQSDNDRRELLAAIDEMGFDFAEAQYLVGAELEKNGEYDEAYQAYVASARLDPEAALPWAGIERLLRESPPLGGRVAD